MLDSTRTDGSTVPFSVLTEANDCDYDVDTGSVSLRSDSARICTVSGGADGYGTPVEIDVYVWLEGCDEDCTRNLNGKTLTNIGFHFAGVGAQ